MVAHIMQCICSEVSVVAHIMQCICSEVSIAAPHHAASVLMAETTLTF